METSQGVYTWPRTVSGVRAKLPCKSGVKDKDEALYMCDSKGEWTDLNMDACKYTNPVTQLLKDLSTVGDALTMNW